jgi:hypothetical protein
MGHLQGWYCVTVRVRMAWLKDWDSSTRCKWMWAELILILMAKENKNPTSLPDGQCLMSSFPFPCQNRIYHIKIFTYVWINGESSTYNTNCMVNQRWINLKRTLWTVWWILGESSPNIYAAKVNQGCITMKCLHDLSMWHKRKKLLLKVVFSYTHMFGGLFACGGCL